MARGTQFGDLINMFRNETGHAQSRRLGKNEIPGIMALLRRTYRRLHADFMWPHLVIERDETLLAGERYYSYPAEIDFDYIDWVAIREAGQDDWYKLRYGIDLAHLNTVDSDQGEREDFPYSWEIYQNDQYEVWPVPETSGHTIRFKGRSRAKPLTSESDIVDLDDDLIVLYAAAEQLARDRSADAETKLQLARQHYMRLRGNTQKQGNFSMTVSKDRLPAYRGINIEFAERRD